MYDDAETLWGTTIARNPASWLAHNNLGNALFRAGQVGEALAQFQAALALQPDFAPAHNGLGNALLRKERAEEAFRTVKEECMWRSVRASETLEFWHSIGGRTRKFNIAAGERFSSQGSRSEAGMRPWNMGKIPTALSLQLTETKTDRDNSRQRAHTPR